MVEKPAIRDVSHCNKSHYLRQQRSLRQSLRQSVLMLKCLYEQNEAAYHAVDGTDGHVDMDEEQRKKRQRKDKKVDLDNLKREVEMVSVLSCLAAYLIN